MCNNTAPLRQQARCAAAHAPHRKLIYTSPRPFYHRNLEPSSTPAKRQRRSGRQPALVYSRPGHISKEKEKFNYAPRRRRPEKFALETKLARPTLYTLYRYTYTYVRVRHMQRGSCNDREKIWRALYEVTFFVISLAGPLSGARALYSNEIFHIRER